MFNVIFDPLVGYYYKLLILGKPAAELALAWNIASTSINAVTLLHCFRHHLHAPSKCPGQIRIIYKNLLGAYMTPEKTSKKNRCHS